MSSILNGYEYDIFISYRQKDNKHDGWVSEFVDNLRGELEATFKEEISLYFDINPHDGLLEIHDVNASLKDKLKCLIFIPIISRTYCDPKSFAWEHEFRAFVEQASQDQYGLKIKLPGGNVASRVLPVRIYDLNKEDLNLCESVLGGALRGIEFIYKSAGVNRPLRAHEDHTQDNLNKTYYRDQINKMSHSIQEIIQGMKTEQHDFIPEEKVLPRLSNVEVKKIDRKVGERKLLKIPWLKVLYSIILLVVLTAIVLVYPKIFKRDRIADMTSKEILDKAIAVCDVYSGWNDYYGKIRLIYERDNGQIYSDQIIEIQTKEGFYKCTSTFFGKLKTVTGIKNGQCFMEVDENSDPEGVLLKKLSLNCELVLFVKEHHYCIFGLLMQLKASGLDLNENVIDTKFLGNDCFALTFTSDTNKVKNSYFRGTDWTVYIDPINYSMKGYRTNGVMSGYYVNTGNVEVNGINIPLCRMLFNPDNLIFSVEMISLPE
jgi:Family of unknown function (DUF6503)